MTLYGWDASDFDANRGPVNVVAARNDGISFITHKATEGTSVTHARYGPVLNAARATQVEFLGPYMVPRTPGNNGHGLVSAQVDYFLSYVNQQTPWWRTYPGFFFQVDTEHWSSGGVVYDAVPASVGAEACRLIRQRTGRQVFHYAPRWSYGDTIPGSDPLWASDYGANPAVHYRTAYPGDSSSRWAPYSGRVPVILQYGARTVIGTQQTCDANAFRGSAADFRALLRGGGVTTEGDDGMSWDEAATILVGSDSGGFSDNPNNATVPSWVKAAVGYNLKNLHAKVDSLVAAAQDAKARQAAEATEIAGLKAALLAVTAALQAGGTGTPLDTTAVIKAVQEASTSVRELVERRHTDEMAELVHERNAEIAGLLAEVEALKQGQGAS